MNYKKILDPKRLLQEVLCPSYSLSTALLLIIHSIRLVVLDILPSSSKNLHRPVVVWDIRSSPITFDFVWFLFYFVNLLTRLGFDDFDLLIYIDPQKSKQLVPDIPNYSSYVTNSDLLARITSLIQPIAFMSPYVHSVSVVESRKEARAVLSSYKNVFPHAYSVDLFYASGFNYFSCFRQLLAYESYYSSNLDPVRILSSDNASAFVDFTSSSYATFTLRDYGFRQQHNTSERDLAVFLDFCVSRSLLPVIVPDSNFHPFPSLLSKYPTSHLFPDARKYLGIRALLYSSAVFNLFSPSGPADFSMHLHSTKTIMYNYAVGGTDNTLEPFAVNGYPVGSQPFSRLNCFLLWHSSTTVLTCDALSFALSSLSDS